MKKKKAMQIIENIVFFTIVIIGLTVLLLTVYSL